jgi:hypothetical protein
MPKFGVINDYDLMANQEKTAKDRKCVICGSYLMIFQWSDYSGEAMCSKCGCPYQLKWGTEEQQKEGNYPYLNLMKKGIPIIKEYWEQRKVFTCFGTMLGRAPGMAAFNHWLEINHPEIIKKGKDK